MSGEIIEGDTLGHALTNLFAVVDGDAEPDTAEYDRAMEHGLTDEQRQVADRHTGDGRFEVDESTVPTFGDKLAAGKKIPWTFTIDGVRFVKKTSMGSGSSVADSEWWWTEDGYRFTFYKHNDGPDEVSIDAA
ncbi:hypothetical protein [Natronorubrum texcoconense]|uniref:Uncharacterized protein n=1 Tax=Natronorubrum texcoconense TaxID=1095776 RepID=A0A1G9HBI3_9EURY|nr:hypothetical protein [Natronorubrum texcoconense]SDL09833.1 hypothetical protein SAMN04515672_0168 [Natronorubrum texcoconense]